MTLTHKLFYSPISLDVEPDKYFGVIIKIFFQMEGLIYLH